MHPITAFGVQVHCPGEQIRDIWLDTAGRERLRFMRPNGVNPSASQWSRQANGYFRWQDEAGNYLDIDGNVVPPSHPQFNERTHIMYEGP